MKKLFTLITLLSITYLCEAQKVKPQITVQSLKDSIKKIMQTQHITGLMVGITKADSVILSEGFGFADLETKRKVDSKTLFRMGSNTKMFVSLGILKLQKEGKININDEIKKIAPEIKFTNDWEAKYPLRVVHLLEHTSGFDDMKINAMYSLDAHERDNLLTVNQNSLVCRWKPGERHAYSNPNYNLLGYLIEKITQKPFNQYLTEEILSPLGMKTSNFNLRSKTPLDTKEYVFRDGKTQLVPSVTVLGGPQGSLWSNADDMIKLLQMYLKNGQSIFDETIINEMETPHSGLGAKAGLQSGYALGNYYTHFYNKYGFRGHNGLTGTCFSTCIYNRKMGVGFVIASNSNYNNGKIEELVSAFLEQNLPKIPIKTQVLDVKAIESYLGFYQFDSPRNEIGRLMDKFSIAPSIALENGNLYLVELTGNKTKLLQTSPLTFMREGMNIATIAFTKNDEGKNVMMMGGTYFEQSSYAWGLFWRGAMILMIALILISGIVAIGTLIGAFMDKIAWKQVFRKFLPILSIIILGFSMTKLIEKQQFSYALYKFREINAETLLIFGGTFFFGVAGLICLYWAIQSFFRNKNRWFAWYWLLTYSSVFLLAAILFYYGFIGIRVWAL